MNIKKYEAVTEEEAIQKAKLDLGNDIIILNIKKINPKGFFRLFRSPKVEVLVAFEEQKSTVARKREDPTMKNLEKKIDHLEHLLYNMADQSYSTAIDTSYSQKNTNNMMNILYTQMVENEVEPEVANKILENIGLYSKNNETDINKLVGIVYNRIIQWIGEPKPLRLKSPTQVIFIGPTGVGKTTTIAKIVAHHVLQEKQNVGLITADTYRIAAVEQLKTYAEILGTPVEVVYSKEELASALDHFSQKDGVFIDTAGRSHKNKEQLEELSLLLNQLSQKKVYLVLSLTTKYNDLKRIIQMYSAITDFHIILTKMDETTCLGNILNIRMLTSQPFSYITFGQNVPEDMELLNPQKVAKIILGSYEE